jgi:uncharacterized protein YfiM (DUF2279 family)
MLWLIPSVAALFLTSALAAGVAVAAWHRRQAVGGLPFALLMAATAEWALAGGLEAASLSQPAKILWSKVEYLGSTAVAPLFLICNYSA